MATCGPASVWAVPLTPSYRENKNVITAGWILCLLLSAAIVPSTLSLYIFRLVRRSDQGSFPQIRPEQLPRLTIVVAARDEQQQIENALRSFLKCDYPDLRVIAVNDRSQDDTGRIMDRVDPCGHNGM